MYKFGKRSLDQRKTLHPKLQKIVDTTIKYVDFSILEGVRSLDRQKELVAQGKSKTLKSKHLPDKNGQSRAMDLAPSPIDWNNRERFILFAGFILGIASSLNIKVVWGGDWNGDFDTKDTGFFDAPHFELDESEE